MDGCCMLSSLSCACIPGIFSWFFFEVSLVYFHFGYFSLVHFLIVYFSFVEVLSLYSQGGPAKPSRFVYVCVCECIMYANAVRSRAGPLCSLRLRLACRTRSARCAAALYRLPSCLGHLCSPALYASAIPGPGCS